MNNKVLCKKCREDVDYNVVIDKNDKVNIFNIDIPIPFEKKKAYCKKCGSEVYVEEIFNYNLDRIQKLIFSNVYYDVSDIMQILKCGKKKAYEILNDCPYTVTIGKLKKVSAVNFEQYLDTLRNISSMTTYYDVDYPLFSTVYIIDRFDVENNCSQWGDGSGSKKIQNKVRECFVTQISVCGKDKESGRLYYVQPRKLTEAENNGIKNFYFEKSFYAKDLYKSREQAEEKLKEKEW